MSHAATVSGLVEEAVYRSADLTSTVPDVDQWAGFLHRSLAVRSPDLAEFTSDFLAQLARSDILRKCFYDGVRDGILSLREQWPEVRIAAWTQGNVFLQARKAELFAEALPGRMLASPSVYASTDKFAVLPEAVSELRQQGCQEVAIIDDRPDNIRAAHELLGSSAILMRKVRPDKKVEAGHYLPGLEFSHWREVAALLETYRGCRLGILLDQDGVVYDTTHYRKLLCEHLPAYLEANYLPARPAVAP